MSLISEKYQIRLQELAGITPNVVYYNSHGYSMPFSEFIEVEVGDRENYTMNEVLRWQKKYDIKDDEEVIWVTPNKRMAQTYMASADKYDDLLKARSDEEVLSIFQNDNQEITDIKQVEPYFYTKKDGFIIPESNDGQEGLLMVLRPNDDHLKEAVSMNRADLYKAYENAANRILGFDIELIKRAIAEGRAIGILYRSEDMPIQKYRVILPVTLGTYKTKTGHPLKLSAFHLGGQSEKAARQTGKRSAETENVWRLFDLDRKKFKAMFLTDDFFFENPPGYKRTDSRFSNIIAAYNPRLAKMERDKRITQGGEPGKPVDFSQVQTQIPKPETTPETQTEKPEQNITEKEKNPLYVKKPWLKYLRNDSNFKD